MIKGCFVKKGALIDATIIEAPINKSNGKKEWVDKDASSTKKDQPGIVVTRLTWV